MKINETRSIRIDEDDANTVLDALRQLEGFAFILPVPEIVPEKEQPSGTLVIQSVREIDDGPSILYRATLARTAALQEKRTFEVKICERIGDAVEGRTEIAVVRDLSVGVWRWSVRIGKTRSEKIRELCGQQGLNLNMTVAVFDEVIDEGKAFIVLGTIARWTNQLLFLT